MIDYGYEEWPTSPPNHRSHQLKPFLSYGQQHYRDSVPGTANHAVRFRPTVSLWLLPLFVNVKMMWERRFAFCIPHQILLG